MKSTFLYLLAFVSVLGLVSGPRGAEISGRITADGASRAPLEAEDLEHVVVAWIPADAAKAPAQPTATMETRGKAFAPRVLAITPGTTVEFPNFDPILHNVFSMSKAASFDAGLYGEGESRSHTFGEPGVVRVYCNVHQSMVGFILILPTPHVTRPGPDGSFVLVGLPEGAGTLRVWSERSDIWERELTAGAAGVEAALMVKRRRLPSHRDKDGKSYRRRGERDY